MEAAVSRIGWMFTCALGLCRRYAGTYDAPGQGLGWARELRCGLAVIEEKLDRGAGRELDAHDPPFLLALEDTIFLAVDTL